MIGLKVKTKDLIDHSRIRGIPIEVNNYIFNNMSSVLNKIENKIATYIYTVLDKKTGKLAKSIRTIKKKTNQFGSMFEFYFETDVAPHAPTVIGKGPVTIKAKNHKYLTVPFPGQTMYKRVKPGMTFNPRGKIWSLGGTKLFRGRESVTIKKRVNPDKIQDIFEFETQYGVEQLLQRAINKFN